MAEPGTNKYVVIDKDTQVAVREGLRTRQEARIAKRELEYAHKAANNFRPVPSRYFVESGIDHPAGAGNYYH